MLLQFRLWADLSTEPYNRRNGQFMQNSQTGFAGSLASFVRTERSPTPPRAEVLIGGNSTNGLGVHRAELEKKLGRPVGKATVDGCWVWEFDRILKKYPEETKNVKVVLLSLRWNELTRPVYDMGFQKGPRYGNPVGGVDRAPPRRRWGHRLACGRHRTFMERYR